MANVDELIKELFLMVCAEDDVSEYYDDIEGAMEFAVRTTVESLEMRGLLKSE